MDYFISSYCVIKDYSVFRNNEKIFGQKDEQKLDDFLNKVYADVKINYPKFYKMDNLSKLGLIASEVVLKGRVLKEEYKPEEIAVILSNASASLDSDIKYLKSSSNLPSPALFVYTLPNIVMGELCIRHGFKGENGFFVFEKFNAEFITKYVTQVLEQGAKACLAGWVEVLGEQHNVFLYLVENKRQDVSVHHTTSQVEKLYQ